MKRIRYNAMGLSKDRNFAPSIFAIAWLIVQRPQLGSLYNMPLKKRLRTAYILMSRLFTVT